MPGKRLLFAALMILTLAACREIPADRLYALRLEQAPAEADWQRALPRTVTVRGGRAHKREPLAGVDEDTVHTSTASCHHGSTPPAPLAVDLRAFYTDDELFLRLSWPDPTPDRAMLEWEFDGAAWKNLGGLEDGFGLLWDAAGRFPRFTCSYACHLHDFGVAGDNFHATNRMQLAREDAWLDLWHWKAQRTGRFGFADDRFLDRGGMQGDLPGEIFLPNSRFARGLGGEAEPFSEGDAPIYDYQGIAFGKGFLPPGTRAPGYLTEPPAGGRGEIRATSAWRDGRWEVVLRRPLRTGDPRDVAFLPGDEAGVAFGVAVMDSTLREHYASSTEERLVLMARPQKAGAQKETR